MLLWGVYYCIAGRKKSFVRVLHGAGVSVVAGGGNLELRTKSVWESRRELSSHLYCRPLAYDETPRVHYKHNTMTYIACDNISCKVCVFFHILLLSSSAVGMRIN